MYRYMIQLFEDAGNMRLLGWFLQPICQIEIDLSVPRGIRIDNLPARATQFISVNFEHIPAELLAHLTLGVATCKAAGPLIENALREG